MLFVGGRAELFQGIPVSIPGVTVGHIKRGHHDIGISSPATERDGLALGPLPGHLGGVASTKQPRERSGCGEVLGKWMVWQVSKASMESVRGMWKPRGN